MNSISLPELNDSVFFSLKDCLPQINNWLNDSCILREDKEEILNLIKNKNIEELRDRFYRDIEFGTGGLRGIMGMGTNRMNRYVLRRAVQGVANYILKLGDKEKNKGVAIAYDSRNNSHFFGLEAACVLAANNIPCFIFNTLQPTPLLSYTIRKLGCISGFCFTASHNPPEYNGIKIYWDDGAQVISPHDTEILKEVYAISSFSAAKFLNYDDAIQKQLIRFIPQETIDSYFQEIKNLSNRNESELDKTIQIVYTPLHGTGKIPTLIALNSLGYKNVFVVPEQAEPNGNFPTVSKPNPEEKEALLLAIQYAQKMNAECVLATDPDSDRLALVCKEPVLAHSLMKHQAVGDYVLLNGNQTGALIIEYLLKSMHSNKTLTPQHKIVKTIVTSELHEQICKNYNVEVFNTLTGFKWIAGLVRSWEKENNGYQYLFGTEESFGYMPNNSVRDKDAIAALCQVIEMISYYKKQGLSLCEQLFKIFEKYGAWQEDLINLELYGEKGAQQIESIMKTMRAKPISTWNGVSLKKVYDFNDINTQNAFHVPKSNVLQFLLEDGSKISMRPSGTEPKLKIYVSVCTHQPEVHRAYQETLNKIQNLRKEISNFIHEVTQ